LAYVVTNNKKKLTDYQPLADEIAKLQIRQRVKRAEEIFSESEMRSLPFCIFTHGKVFWCFAVSKGMDINEITKFSFPYKSFRLRFCFMKNL
jgi:hypothetical protein